MNDLNWSEKLAVLAKEAQTQGWWIARELRVISTKVAQLEADLNIEKQKHLDTSNWALEQQDRADRAEAALKGKS